MPPLDGRGHVVLLHEAGGDRSAGTVAMLEKLITRPRRRATPSPRWRRCCPRSTSRRRVAPSLADQAALLSLQAVWIAPGKLFGFLFWFGTGSLVVVSFLYLLLADLNECARAPEGVAGYPTTSCPSCRGAGRVQRGEGDRPDTGHAARKRLSRSRSSRCRGQRRLEGPDPGDPATATSGTELKVVDQPNSGKSSAINNGINHADPTLDGHRDHGRRHPVPPRHHPHAGPALRRQPSRQEAGGRGGRSRQGGQPPQPDHRLAVPGVHQRDLRDADGRADDGRHRDRPRRVLGLGRRALERIGGFNEDTLAEDADATLELQKLGYAVVNENQAICDTEAPETIVALAKQRKRWTFGNVQVLWKHRSMFFRPRYGMLGMLAMPYAALLLLVPAVPAGPVDRVRREPGAGDWRLHRDVRRRRDGHAHGHRDHRGGDCPREGSGIC